MRVPVEMKQRRAYFSRPLTTLSIAIACSWSSSIQGQSDQLASKMQMPSTTTSLQSTAAPSPLNPVEVPSKPLDPVQAAAALSSEALLKKLGARVDVQAKSDEIFAHLTEVTRNYHISVTLIQKVGEPVDAIYREQSITNAKLVSTYAFQSGSADADLLMTYALLPSGREGKQSQSESQRMQEALTSVNEKIEALDAKKKTLDDQLTKSYSRDEISDTRTRLEQTQAALEFDLAMRDALVRIAGMADAHNRTGLEGEIERLRQTAPGMTDVTVKLVPAPLTALDIAHSGIMSQASALFRLLATRQALDKQARENDLLHRQAVSLQLPLSNVLIGMIQEGDALSQQGPVIIPVPGVESAVASPPQPNAMPTQTTVGQLNAIDAAIKILSASAVPRSQEIIALERSGANLSAWRTAVDIEYNDVRRSLLQRLLVIAVALGLILILDKAWQLASIHHVKDLRRRRQLQGIRRLVTVFLCAVVIIFGFVTQFDSLATFAGFITAGLAVALQTILLSVAAYFFVVGRYGIRVGDRISVASVTGDVVDVGLLRFYLMELTVSGLGFQPTGRVAVFSNAILFQAGTPLYKQMPGTNYAWHEMTVMLKPGEAYTHVVEALLGVVEKVYDGYKTEIEQQYNDRESTMDYGMNAPRLQSRLQLVGGGPQLTVRFPVKVQEASRVTEQVAEAMLLLIKNDEPVRQAVESQPVITPAVKF